MGSPLLLPPLAIGTDAPATWSLGFDYASVGRRVHWCSRFVAVETAQQAWASGYISPNCCLKKFQRGRDELERHIRSCELSTIVGGDLNAHFPTWSCADGCPEGGCWRSFRKPWTWSCTTLEVAYLHPPIGNQSSERIPTMRTILEEETLREYRAIRLVMAAAAPVEKQLLFSWVFHWEEEGLEKRLATSWNLQRSRVTLVQNPEGAAQVLGGLTRLICNGCLRCRQLAHCLGKAGVEPDA